MSPRAQLFNVRMDDDLMFACEEKAAEEGLTKSVWAREVLGAVALGGVTLDMLRRLVERAGLQDMQPHPSRFLPLQGQNGRSEKERAKCLHPTTAVHRLPFTDICGVCGATLRRR